MRSWTSQRYRRHILMVSLVGVLLGWCGPMKGQETAGRIDIFAGVDFNYRDLTAKRM